ncbi:MAG TPA: alpha/beta hydrolase family protein [Chitinophagaceae bacterium]|nr:alpha/beta hydrolase family protein [Chitinophagaceae bacterium]
MMKVQLYLIIFLAGRTVTSFSETVDSIEIASNAMKKAYMAAVVLPDSYKKNKSSYPVLYLLHGGGGHFRDWLTLTPDKMLVKNLVDQYNIIVVMPEGETFGWYLNSPLNKQSQFESYVIDDVIGKIDKTYRTVKDRKGRVITGLSMGGHGALYLSGRHPDLFCAAGSMSGAVDLNWTNWRIPADFLTRVKQGFQNLIGDTTNMALYASYSVVNMTDKMSTNNVKLIIDCGVDDFLVESNRELHHRLVYNHTPHDYTEHPGAHTWDYWQNSLPYQVLFFYNVLKANGVTVL